jgi:hypothetical protein
MHPKGTMTRVENNTEIEKDKPNLPRLLQEVGYKTGFVGKSHIVEHNIVNNKKIGQKMAFKPMQKMQIQMIQQFLKKCMRTIKNGQK